MMFICVFMSAHFSVHQAATEKVLTSGDTEGLKDTVKEESCPSEKTTDSPEKGPR